MQARGAAFWTLSLRNASSGSHLNIILTTDAGKDLTLIGTSYYNDSAGTTLSTAVASGITVNGWHKIRLYHKGEASASSSDGIIRLWVDDSLKVEDTAVNNNSYKDMKIIRFGNPYSEIDSTTMNVYFDNFRLRTDASF